MPLYMDVHDLTEVSPEQMAEAYLADEEYQAQWGVEYIRYWVNKCNGKLYCLVRAPDLNSATHIHHKSHGFSASKVIEVTPELVEAFLMNADAATSGPTRVTDLESETITQTILLTDIVNSTAITQKLGDKEAMLVIEYHDAMLRSWIAVTSGLEIKHTGDGIMACWSTPAKAIHCAVRVIQELYKNPFEYKGINLQLRIGIATGELFKRKNDLFGSTIQLTERLCEVAEPNEILASSSTVELCTDCSYSFIDRGYLVLKGFNAPQKVLTVKI